jgi:hypothetical protein
MPRVNAAASIALVIACLAPRIVVAQSPAEVQVRAVVDSFFAASVAERWDVAAKLLDMEKFDLILKAAQGNARANLPARALTVEQLMAEDSTMPRAVAEWQVARFSKYSHDPYEFLTYEFSRVSTPREFLALTADEAAERWLEAQDFRYLMRVTWKRAGCRGELPAVLAIPERHTVLGIAIGNDSTAYAIHTIASGGLGPDISSTGSPPSVMVLARRHSAWRINPSFSRDGFGAVGFGPQCGK